ncbi:MAG: MBL fold metallo-hydrolase [bacterium]|nr:MBL fold metallo-hydrolase [bacterium]
MSIEEILKLVENENQLLRENYIKSYKIKEEEFGIVLGSPYCYIYLIEDVLVDISVSAWAYLLLNLIKNKYKINYLLLTHSHYDHLGGAYLLKENFKNYFENLKIIGHNNITNVLKSTNAIKIISDFNYKDSSEIYNILKINELSNFLEFKTFNLDYELQEKEKIINLSNLVNKDIKVIFVSGHTKDSVSYYFVKENVLIMGESMGVPNHKFTFVLPEFLTSYIHYKNNIKFQEEFIIDKKINNFLLPHIMYFTSFNDVKDFIKLSYQSLELYTKKFLEYISKTKINLDNFDSKIEEVFKYILEDIYIKYELTQPIYAFKANITAQVKSIIKELT